VFGLYRKVAWKMVTRKLGGQQIRNLCVWGGGGGLGFLDRERREKRFLLEPLSQIKKVPI
jgi:hypothetical protein